MRDGAARGRRPALRASVDEAVRRRFRPRPAGRGAHRLPSGIARTSSDRRRTSTRRSSRSAASSVPDAYARVKSVVDGGVRAPAEDAPELARARRSGRRDRAVAALERDRPAGQRAGRGARAGRVRGADEGARSEARRGDGEDQPRARRRTAPSRRQARGRHRLPARRTRGSHRCGAGAADLGRRVRRRHARARCAHDPRRGRRHDGRVRRDDPEAHPGRGGARRRQLRRGDRAPARERARWTSRCRRSVCTSSLPASAPTSRSSSATGRSSGEATGRRWSRSISRRTTGCSSSIRTARRRPRRGTSTRAFDARAGDRGFAARRDRLREALTAVRRPRDLAHLPPNDLASSPVVSELSELGAFRADVTGAGPAVYGLFLHGADARAAEARMRSAGANLDDRTSVVPLTPMAYSQPVIESAALAPVAGSSSGGCASPSGSQPSKGSSWRCGATSRAGP